MHLSTLALRVGVVLAVLASAGCGGTVERDTAPEPTSDPAPPSSSTPGSPSPSVSSPLPPAPSADEHHPRFAGLWYFTERVPRGGWAMAIWELGSSGELAMKVKEEVSGDASALGGVLRESDGTRCRIGQSWSSVAADRLRFVTTCTDGVDRVVTYRFPEDTSQNSSDPQPTLEDVSGERSGWTAQDRWGFMMRKCASLETCR